MQVGCRSIAIPSKLLPPLPLGPMVRPVGPHDGYLAKPTGLERAMEAQKGLSTYAAWA